MATVAVTTASHLLSPERVDQLVIEHYDPADYPRYPADLIEQHAALLDEITHRAVAPGMRSQQHEDTDRLLVDDQHARWLDATDERVAALQHTITARLRDRQLALEALYRALEPVAATREHSPTSRYLGAQQWLLHVRRAATAHIRRADKRRSVLAVAEALAEHARADGIFLAGVVDVQTAAGIAHSTWTRAAAWLAEHDLLSTLSEGRLLTQLERAIAIGSGHTHVHRWRSVLQLQHTASHTLRPANWVPPVRRTVNEPSPHIESGSTDLRPVDNGAARRNAASPQHQPKKTRRWRTFDPLTSVLWKRLQYLAARLEGVIPTHDPLTEALGRQITPQRTQLVAAIRAAGANRLLPHLKRFAEADVTPASLLVAIEDAEWRSGREGSRRSWDPTRRLIAALRDLTLDDVRSSL